MLDFESSSEHFMHGFVSRQSRVTNPSAVLVNSQLVCLSPVEILKTCYV